MEAESVQETMWFLLGFNRLYGVQWRAERSLCWRVMKFISVLIMVHMAVDRAEVDIFDPHHQREQFLNIDPLLLRLSLARVANIGYTTFICYFFCLWNWNHWTQLVKELGKFWPEANVSRKIKVVQLLFFAFFLLGAGGTFLFSDPPVSESHEYLLLDIAFTFILQWMDLLLSIFYYQSDLFLSSLALIVCLVAYYINLTFHQLIENVKKCRSPIRRAKMMSKLIVRYGQLQGLGTKADYFGAVVMFGLKFTAGLVFLLVLYSCLCLRFYESLLIDIVAPMLIDTHYFLPLLIYFWYLRVAPSANQMASQISKLVMESQLIDDQWLARDPISRPFLLKMRMVHLAHLMHIALDRQPFTMLNEPADEEGIFTFFVEMNDTWNSIASTVPLTK